jgi:hypothetical protein
MGDGRIERTAACACGQLSIRVRGEPLRVGMCHCLKCQRRTGSLFGAGCFFDVGQVVETAGAERTYSRAGDSGRTVTFHFCPDCGSSVFWTRDHRPDLMTVAVGAFADPGFPKATVAFWTEHSHGWLALPEDLPTFAQNS